MFYWNILLVLSLLRHGDAVTPNHFYISLTLNTSWEVLCPQIDVFRNTLSNRIKINYNRIQFANQDDHCTKRDTSKVNIFLYVKQESSPTVDLKATLDIEKKLKKGDVIERYKIESFELINTKNVKGVIYTPKTIGVVISIVLIIYLIGYLLILSMKSYTRSDTKERPISWILSAENTHFTKEDGFNGKKSSKNRWKIFTSKSSNIVKVVPHHIRKHSKEYTLQDFN